MTIILVIHSKRVKNIRLKVFFFEKKNEFKSEVTTNIGWNSVKIPPRK